MHTVELLQDALEVSQSLGYGVRYEWLGTGGGACEIAGRKWIFVDLATTTGEQLEMVSEVILHDPRLDPARIPGNLARWLGLRRAA